MTLSGIFYLIGDIFYWCFQWLQNDFWLSTFMNNAIIATGFIGLFYWLNKQRKFNAAAEKNPDQLK